MQETSDWSSLPHLQLLRSPARPPQSAAKAVPPVGLPLALPSTGQAARAQGQRKELSQTFDTGRPGSLLSIDSLL